MEELISSGNFATALNILAIIINSFSILYVFNEFNKRFPKL